MRKGPQVTNCFCEKMMDDATNVNGWYGNITAFHQDSGRLYYIGGPIGDPRVGSPSFRKGDRTLVYHRDGRLLCDATAQSDGVTYGKLRCVVIDKTFTFGEQLLIENASANGEGFLYDNCLVQNNRSRGFLIKAPGGKITNCTLKDNGLSASLVSPELSANWRECGFVWDFELSGNRFVDGGFFTGAELHSPVNISGDSFPMEDAAYYNHRNISVTGNMFEGRYTQYCINANSVDGLTIKDNVFGPVNKKSSQNADNTQPVLHIQGARAVEISGNTYPETALEKADIGLYVTDISSPD
jgi:hypothetical protein